MEMTSINTNHRYEVAKQASQSVAWQFSRTPRGSEQTRPPVTKSGSGTSGVVTLRPDYNRIPGSGGSELVSDFVTPMPYYGPIPPHTNSNLFVIVHVPPIPVIGKMRELRAAFSINKSQLAEVLRVTRPTIRDWFQGKEPNAASANRIGALLRILARASISGAEPLNARFVRQPMELGAPSIIDLLAAADLDEDRIVQALKQAREHGEEATNIIRRREDRQRALGFNEPTNEERRKRLALNMALKDWPKR